MPLQNDWIVAGLNNPEFTTSDFGNIAGLTTDNTQLLSADDYMKSDFIKNNPLFKDDNGKFSKDKFMNYYNYRASEFADFQQDNFSKGPALDMFDIDRTTETPIKDIHFDIRRGVNPDRQAIGITGVNKWSDPEFSRRELAKQNKVFNTEKGEFEDYTVNDHTLVNGVVNWVKDLFKDPLVLATWDEDGEHIDPITGLVQQHRKGEEKLNDKGTYYYETLGNRSVLGKDVLSLFDTFTVDGQGINKYDFFDSNDIKKSAMGTIVKNVVSLLPLFMGPVGMYYSTALVAREMAKAAPALYGIATSLLDAEMPSWMNKLTAVGQKLSSSVSDYGKQNMFAFENFGNLVADVSLQWGQQQAIARTFTNTLKKQQKFMADAEAKAMAMFNKERAAYAGREAELMTICRNKYIPEAEALIRNSTQATRDISMLYMAILLNDGVYEEMLDHGATKTEAAAVTLGSILGTFTIDKVWHLGEVFFDEATPNAVKQARTALREEYNKAREALDKVRHIDTTPQNKFLKLIDKACKTTKATLNKFNEDLKYHTLTMTEKMIASGLQNAAEVLASDVSKSLYELAGQFGFNTAVKDVGSWDNAFDRYVMNFLGGVVGGGIFYGKEVWDTRGVRRPQMEKDMVTVIRNGHANDLRNQLDAFYNEGRLGSKTTSAANPEVIDGKLVWKSTDNPEESQAREVYNLINDKINAFEEILLANRDVNLTDEQLLNNMVLSEVRYNQYKNIEDITGVTNYYQDYANILQDFVNASNNYRTAMNTVDGTPTGNTIPTDTTLGHLTPELQAMRAHNLEEAEQKAKDAKQKVLNFLSGNTSLDYVRKLNFAMDPVLHSPFLEVSKDEYFQAYFKDKNPSDIEMKELAQFEMVEWPKYVKEQLKTKLSLAWGKYKEFAKVIDPHLHELAEQAPAYRTWVENVQGLFGENGAMFKTMNNFKGWDQKLDNETDEEFENRNKPITDPNTNTPESAAQQARRQSLRYRKLDAHNEQVAQEFVDNIMNELQKVNMQVDSITANMIRASLSHLLQSFAGNKDSLQSVRIKDMIRNKIGKYVGPDNKVLYNKLSSLNNDLSNADKIIQSIYNERRSRNENELESKLAALRLMDVYEADTNNKIPLSEFLRRIWIDPETGEGEGYIDEQTILNAILRNRDDVREGNTAEDWLDGLTEKSKEAVYKAIEDLKQTPLGDMTDLSIYDAAIYGNIFPSSEEVKDALDKVSEAETSPLRSTASTIIEEIRRHPFFVLNQQLKTAIANPVGELLKKVAASNGDEISDLDQMLNTIQNDYENVTDIHQLEMDSVQRENAVKAMHYLDLLKVYLYAASTTPSNSYPIGHNRTINAFAESHSDKLTSPWEKLPEIDADYVAMYGSTILKYQAMLDGWIKLSDQNSIYKEGKLLRIETSLNNALYNLLSKVPTTFVVTKKDGTGKSYNLLEGIESIDEADLSDEDGKFAQVPLYNLERLFFRNVQKCAEAEGYGSVSELVQNTDLLEILIPGIKKLDNQQRTELTEDLSADNFTDYTKLLYFTTLLSDDPANFFAQLKQRVTVNEKIVPITIQEFDTRIAQASVSDTFNVIMEHALEIIDNKELCNALRITVLDGVAGAGKSAVVLAAVSSMFHDQVIWLAAPTETQTKAMREATSRDTTMSFDELMTRIIGENDFKDLKQAIKDAAKESHDCKFFEKHVGNNGLMKINIKPEAFKFIESSTPPKAIFMDEATHFNTVYSLVLNEYAKQMGIRVFMCGDLAQLGYANADNGIQNIDEGSFFAIRAPKLSVSLRDNNIQKFANQEAVRSLLQTVLNLRLYGTEANYAGYFADLKNLIPTLNFRVYNKNGELAGDMIIPSLSDDTVALLKNAADNGKTIAFIGEETSSYLKKLRDAGIDIIKSTDPNTSAESKNKVLSMEEMQGQEFDYVVIDQKFEQPKDTTSSRIFLQKLYTLMTRATTASVFISDTLGDIIGNNIQAQYTAKVPPISNSADRLRARKLEVLEKMDTTGAIVSTNTGETTGMEGATNGERNLFADWVDPDEETVPSKLIAAIQTVATSDEGNDADNSDSMVVSAEGGNNDFDIEAYSNCYYVGAEEGPEETRTFSDPKTGQQYTSTGREWTVTIPETGILRNLQAIETPKAGETSVKAFTRSKKLELQKRLDIVRSIITHNRDLQDKYARKYNFITSKFNNKDWNAGRYLIEFRRPTNIDTLPVHGKFDQVGFEYTINGKKERLIANIVFEVKAKNGRICRFDIAGINNPETLRSKVSTIRANLKARIDKLTDPKDANVKKILQTRHDNVSQAAEDYKGWFDVEVRKFLDEESKDTLTNGVHEFNLEYKDANGETQYIVLHNKTTWFRKRQVPIRFGGNINPDHINVSDIQNLVDYNPELLFSPIYTFSDKTGEAFDALPQSIKGKACVFVTSYIPYGADDLIDIYCNQKLNPNDNTPEVRMLLLDNYGMSFSQLCNTEYLSQFSNSSYANKDGRVSKPFNMNFMGLRMFTSLWNARASLHQFKDALTTWETNHNYTSEQVKAIIEAQDLYYQSTKAKNDTDKKAFETRAINRLKTAKLNPEEAIKALNEFNDVVCKDIPMFRLGYTRNGNGFHVQRFLVKDSVAYKTGKNGGEVNLCVITPDKVDTFLTILNTVIAPIVPLNNSPMANKLASFNIKFGTVDNDSKKFTPWDVKTLIDPDDAKHQRTLSGYLNNLHGQVVLNAEVSGGKQSITFTNGQQWSVVPRLFSHILHSVEYYQRNPGEVANRNAIDTTMDYYTEGGHGSGGKKDASVVVSIADLVGEKGVIKTGTDAKGKVDNTMWHLFDLVFHGTIEDIHGEVIEEANEETGEETTDQEKKPLMQLDDAYFKKGFFINPDLDRNIKGLTNTDIFNKKYDGTVIFYKIGTHPGLFTSDVDVRLSGLRLPLRELLNIQNNAPVTMRSVTNTTGTTNTETTETLNIEASRDAFLETHSLDDVKAIDYYNEEHPDDPLEGYTNKNLEKAYTWRVNQGKSQISSWVEDNPGINRASDFDELLNRAICVDSRGNIMTYERYLKSQVRGENADVADYFEDNDTIENLQINRDGNVLTFTYKDKAYKVDMEVDPFKVTEKTDTLVEQGPETNRNEETEQNEETKHDTESTEENRETGQRTMMNDDYNGGKFRNAVQEAVNSIITEIESASEGDDIVIDYINEVNDYMTTILETDSQEALDNAAEELLNYENAQLNTIETTVTQILKQRYPDIYNRLFNIIC